MHLPLRKSHLTIMESSSKTDLVIWVMDNCSRKGFSSEMIRVYHLAENDYSYKHEIKSKTIGLHQITDITDLN